MTTGTNQHRITTLTDQLARFEAETLADIRDATRPDMLLAVGFGGAIERKMRLSAAKYGYADSPWRDPHWEDEWRDRLMEHIAKGDPRDVAIYCAFGWYHGWSTAPRT